MLSQIAGTPRPLPKLIIKKRLAVSAQSQQKSDNSSVSQSDRRKGSAWEDGTREAYQVMLPRCPPIPHQQIMLLVPRCCCTAFRIYDVCKNGSALLTSQFQETVFFPAQVDISTGFPVAVGYRRQGGEQHWLSWRDQRARNLAARNGEDGSHQGSERSSKSPKLQQSAFLNIVAYIGLCCRCLSI